MKTDFAVAKIRTARTFGRQGNQMSVDENRRRRAHQIAEARHTFRWHFSAYLIVNLVLVLIWFFAGSVYPWPLLLIVFWGIGVFAHYIAAYHSPGGDWTETGKGSGKILDEDNLSTKSE